MKEKSDTDREILNSPPLYAWTSFTCPYRILNYATVTLLWLSP